MVHQYLQKTAPTQTTEKMATWEYAEPSGKQGRLIFHGSKISIMPRHLISRENRSLVTPSPSQNHIRPSFLFGGLQIFSGVPRSGWMGKQRIMRPFCAPWDGIDTNCAIATFRQRNEKNCNLICWIESGPFLLDYHTILYNEWKDTSWTWSTESFSYYEMSCPSVLDLF